VLLKQALTLFGLTPATQMVNVKSDTRQLNQIREWIEKGLITPHVDKIFPADEAHKAHAHVESKHTRGKVVILF
jgi:NADPH:quinone reductase-like Zn-dependent oxidoreductase